jgi:hypothetical protein
MEYHCLAETWFLNQLTTKLYPVLSCDNNILIAVDDDYKINPKNEKTYTKFVIENCNFPGKNGVVHTINSLMPVVLPRPTATVWEVTDHFDLKQGDYYKKKYQKFFDGQNTFKNIKWGGDYLIYGYREDATEPINDDWLKMEGWWWIEVTTPKIMKGKYKVYGHTDDDDEYGEFSHYEVYIDGEDIAYITELDSYKTFWGEVEWTKTETHKVKLVAKTAGMLRWDAITFIPVQ